VTLGLIAGLIALGAFAPGSHGSATGAAEALPAPPSAVKHPKLNSRLASLARLRPRGLDGSSSSRNVRVGITAQRPSAVRALVARLGGRVDASYGRLVEAVLPAARLNTLARDRAVLHVQEPTRAVPEAVRGEGVAVTGAAAWHAAGVRGAGARVAVIDLGFHGHKQSRAHGDLPASIVRVDLCPGSFDGPAAVSHGTAVAEIVAEMAPEARLYLICAQTVAALGQAKDYVRSRGIHVVNHSASWFNTGRGDDAGGPDTPAGIVADARAAGILWVNAAGNRAQQHWSGTFADADGDQWHEFGPEDEGNTILLAPGLRTCVALKWDSWPVTAVDYDLHLLSVPEGVPLASSTTAQTGSQPPTELVCYGNPTTVPQSYSIGIRSYQASVAPRLDLFVYPAPNLEHLVADGSVTEPGSSSSALAVGAVCWQNDGLEPFSSRGPTIDGRLKPDLAGPDWVSSFAYGPFGGCGGQTGFAGTSAATPHVAGAAALVKGANPAFGPNELQQFLEGRAVDLGAPGRDSSYGIGKLALGAAPRAPLRTCVVPRLAGLRLAAARSAIVRAGCSVGRVRRARSRVRRGRVVGQSPRAGKRVAVRARVTLTLSRGRR
jgi:subtilisin family serine protease